MNIQFNNPGYDIVYCHTLFDLLALPGHLNVRIASKDHVFEDNVNYNKCKIVKKPTKYFGDLQTQRKPVAGLQKQFFLLIDLLSKSFYPPLALRLHQTKTLRNKTIKE